METAAHSHRLMNNHKIQTVRESAPQRKTEENIMSVKSVKFSSPIQSAREPQTFPKTPHPAAAHRKHTTSNGNNEMKIINASLPTKPVTKTNSIASNITPFMHKTTTPDSSSSNTKITVHAETGQLQNEPHSSSTITPVRKRQSPTVKATVVAEKLRQQANSTCLNYVRSVKYQAAKLHEHLLKIEEEIKQMSKGRRTLELAIQEARKSLSINQQSLSTQQKRSTRGNEDSIIRVLREEAKTLSKSKRQLESHLQAIKHQLHSLDNVRKTLKNKISSLSKSLQLDAQNYKLYDGPVKPNNITERQYATKYQLPTDVATELPTQLLATVNELIQTSKDMRGGIKPLVTSAHSNQMEAHKKVNTVLMKHKEEIEAQKRMLVLEKGHLRLKQNSIAHETHTTSITLGLVSGPISDQYKSVAEKQDRPLSCIRPGSAIDEIVHAKETKTKLFRQLSASQSKGSSVSNAECSLASKYLEQSMSVSLDSQMLRVRKMSLDNRWVS